MPPRVLFLASLLGWFIGAGAVARALPLQDRGRAAGVNDSVPGSVAGADAQGRAARPASAPTSTQTLFAGEVTGNAERKCVETSFDNPVRSGDFIARGFNGYAGTWGSGYGKVAYLPAHPIPDHPPPIVMRAATVDAQPQEMRVFTSSSFVQSGGAWFYNTGFHLPRRGRWLLVLTAGDDWGCFVFTF